MSIIIEADIIIISFIKSLPSAVGKNFLIWFFRQEKCRKSVSDINICQIFGKCPLKLFDGGIDKNGGFFQVYFNNPMFLITF